MARTIFPAACPAVAVRLIASLAGLSLFLFGCKGDVGPAGPSLSGALTGNVTLYTENGSREYDHSGVSVWIEGSADTTLTDSHGRWRIGGVRTGIYTVMMRKTGYGYTKIPSAQFVGGGDLYLGVKALVADPQYTTPIISIGYDTQARMNVSGAGPGAPPGRNALVFLGHQSVDPLDPSTYVDTLLAAFNNNGIFNSAVVPLHDPRWNFSTGDTVFVHVYPGSGKIDGYVDPSSGRMILSTGTTPAGDAWKFVTP